jgi:heme exporter protein B
VFRDALLVAGKDLRIEWRSRVATTQIVPFALTMLLLFGFALDPDTGMLRAAAAGLFWLAVLLSTVLVVQRSFSLETADGARDGLRLSGMDPASIFFGKAIAIGAQLFALQVVLALGAYVLFDASTSGLMTVLGTCVVATVGLASAGAVYGALVAGGRARETLLPLLFLPVVAPVLLAAARASEAALGSYATDAGPWMSLLVAFALLYAAVGSMVFGSLLEDA